MTTYSGTNLTPINDGQWHLDGNWNTLAPAGNVTYYATGGYNNAPYWKIQGNLNTNIAVDHMGPSILAGHHIVFMCWMKTDAATYSGDVGLTYVGAQIGMDIYGPSGRICAVNNVNGGQNWLPSGWQSVTTTTLPFGNDWTLYIIDFIIPASYVTDLYCANAYNNADGTKGGKTVNITAGSYCIPTLTNMTNPPGTTSENAAVYFSDPIFYYDPSAPPSTYNLTVQAATGGTTTPTPGTYNETANANIIVLSNAAAGMALTDWILDGVNTGVTTTSISILMNSNHTIQPVFTSNTSPTGGTVGNTTIGSVIGHNDANAQSVTYFTPNFTGTINEVIAYVAGASTGNCIAAVYAVSGGAAAALLEQSSPVAISTAYSWVTFPLPSPVNVTSGIPIGLALMGNVQLNIAEVTGAGQRDHNAVSNYTAGFANPFGAIWGTDTAGGMSIYATTPITPTQTFIVNWAVTPLSGNLPFIITFSGYLSRSATAPDTNTIVNGETIQLQVLSPGGTTWLNTGIVETTGSGPLGNGYFSGTWRLIEPTIYPGAWQFRAYYAGNTTKNLFGCVKGGKTRDLSRVNALIW